MTAFDTFARLLGIKPDHAEDALHSERAARAVLTRRNLFAAGGALAAGSVFSFPKPELWPASRSSILADLEDSIRTFTARAKTRPVMIFHPEAARAWARSCS